VSSRHLRSPVLATPRGVCVEDARVKLTVIGCSPAWHNPGGAQSGYLLEGEGRLLLDCGPGVFARMRRQEGWPRVDAIVITHFHLDHWGDLVPWAFGGRFGPGRDAPSPDLWLPPGGLAMLKRLEPTFSSRPIRETFSVHEYADETSFQTAGFEVTPTRVPHYDLLAFGLRVTDGEKTVAYSGDSGPSAALAHLARNADLFVCEATLAGPEPALRGHLTEEEMLDAFNDSGAERLLVVHRPDELPLAGAHTRATDGYETTV
jgi:ribonuclease BN (tRNA processing enzyme)